MSGPPPAIPPVSTPDTRRAPPVRQVRQAPPPGPMRPPSELPSRRDSGRRDYSNANVSRVEDFGADDSDVAGLDPDSVEAAAGRSNPDAIRCLRAAP